MPAFTFEKISPPHRGSYPSTPSQQNNGPQGASSQLRNNVIQVLGRFVVARVREDQQADQPPLPRPLPK